METALGAILFLGAKLAAYSAWCALALAWLAGRRPIPWRRALGLGVLRVLLGLVLGWLFVAGLSAFGPEAANRLGLPVPGLLGGLLLLRWLQWSLIGELATGGGWSVRAFLVGRRPRDFAWRLGGLGLSLATDAAAVMGVGALGLIPC